MTGTDLPYRATDSASSLPDAVDLVRRGFVQRNVDLRPRMKHVPSATNPDRARIVLAPPDNVIEVLQTLIRRIGVSRPFAGQVLRRLLVEGEDALLQAARPVNE
jgi:hypothetical protein